MENAYFSIEITDGGIITSIKDVQPSKIDSLIYVTFGGILIVVNDLHSLKTLPPIIYMQGKKKDEKQ